MVRQSTKRDISLIEEILLDAAEWLDRAGLHMWEKENVKWGKISAWYKPEDFYIVFSGDEPAACAAFVDYDPAFWPELNKGEALFIHKLAVRRRFAGQGYVRELISLAKSKACELGMGSVRLDCHQTRDRLRAFYIFNITPANP